MRKALGAVTVIWLGALGSCSESPSSPNTGMPSGAAAGTGGAAGSSGGSAGTPAGAGVGGAGAGGATVAGAAGVAGTGGASGGSAGGGATAGTPTSGAGGVDAAGSSGMAMGGNAGNAGSGTAGIAGAGPRPTVTAEPGTTLVKVDTEVRYQTFEGWGTSLCWWANHVGGWQANARNAVVDAVVNPSTGLGYNVFRYNIGGGENPEHDHMSEHRDMPGFSPSAGVYTWDADANQRAVLEQIVATGSDVILEAFSNSPPYWMTKSGCAAGNSDGSNNLRDDSYDAFADYLTEVVLHFRDTWGITFRALEPLNEPNASWWTEGNNQEGCHFSPSNQETIILAVAEKLAEKGLTETTVSASDENSMDDAYDNMRAFDDAVLDAMSQMNVHSYAGSRRAEVRELATMTGKRLWQSESGPLGQSFSNDVDAAFFMGARIIQDLRELRPHAWVDWQFGDPSRNWASVTLNDNQETFAPLKRFYVSAHFSRYIRPGAVFVDVNSPDMVAALAPDGRSVTVVVQNRDDTDTRGYTFDLTALNTVGAEAAALRTTRTQNLESLAAVDIEDYRFVVMVPPFSLTTFVIPLP